VITRFVAAEHRPPGDTSDTTAYICQAIFELAQKAGYKAGHKQQQQQQQTTTRCVYMHNYNN